MVLGPFFPSRPGPSRVYLQTPREEGGFPGRIGVALDATSSHLQGRWLRSEGQQTSLPRDRPTASSHIGTGGGSCWLVPGAGFGCRNVPVEGVKIYLLSSPQHIW